MLLLMNGTIITYDVIIFQMFQVAFLKFFITYLRQQFYFSAIINEHLQIVLVSGAINCKQQVDMQILIDADRQWSEWTMNVEVVSEEYSQYAQKVMEDYNIPLPQCWYEENDFFTISL